MAHLLELMCTTTGGNPLPELQWFKETTYITDLLLYQRLSTVSYVSFCCPVYSHCSRMRRHHTLIP
ncbi:hypothetical protein KSF78_0007651 [Schistosoma japonicum]|nr:hypothetical protein KSF78_0007651 [Schistosoma japonicum]